MLKEEYVMDALSKQYGERLSVTDLKHFLDDEEPNKVHHRTTVSKWLSDIDDVERDGRKRLRRISDVVKALMKVGQVMPDTPDSLGDQFDHHLSDEDLQLLSLKKDGYPQSIHVPKYGFFGKIPSMEKGISEQQKKLGRNIEAEEMVEAELEIRKLGGTVVERKPIDGRFDCHGITIEAIQADDKHGYLMGLPHGIVQVSKRQYENAYGRIGG